MKLKILCFFFAFFSLPETSGQIVIPEPRQPELKKNVFYGTLGINVWEFYGTLIGNYERRLYISPGTKGNSLWFRAGAGPYGAWGDEGWNYVSTISLLTGKKSSHVELGAGFLLSWDSSAKSIVPLLDNNYIAANLGYRYQKPGGSFIFRTGMDWPEFMYVSLGFCL